MEALKKAMERELQQLTDFWAGPAIDPVYGGICASCPTTDPKDIVRDAPKTLIGQARALYGLSAACTVLHRPDALTAAENVYCFLRDRMLDRENGCAYFSVERDGTPLNTNKQVYTITFVIYAFVEYYKASGCEEALREAIAIYRSLEAHTHDAECGGYFAEFTADWHLVCREDGSENTDKKFTAHQHLLESYGQLYSVWRDAELAERINDLIGYVCGSFVRKPDGYFLQLLTRDFAPADLQNNIGDTAEMIWLIRAYAFEAADAAHRALAEECIRGLEAQLLQFVDGEFGGIYSKVENGILNTQKVWWEECEAVSSFLSEYTVTGDAVYLHLAKETWSCCEQHLIQPNGLWLWAVERDGTPVERNGGRIPPLPDFYHTARVCVRGLQWKAE